jgi:hypothetical protein
MCRLYRKAVSNVTNRTAHHPIKSSWRWMQYILPKHRYEIMTCTVSKFCRIIRRQVWVLLDLLQTRSVGYRTTLQYSTNFSKCYTRAHLNWHVLQNTMGQAHKNPLASVTVKLRFSVYCLVWTVKQREFKSYSDCSWHFSFSMWPFSPYTDLLCSLVRTKNHVKYFNWIIIKDYLIYWILWTYNVVQFAS